MDYLGLSKIMKAIAEPNRLQILDMIGFVPYLVDTDSATIKSVLLQSFK